MSVEEQVRNGFRRMFRNEGNKRALEFISSVQNGQNPMPEGFPMTKNDFLRIGKEEADRYWKLLTQQ